MADSLTTGSYELTYSVGTKSDDSDRLNQVRDEVRTGDAKFPDVKNTLTSGTGAGQATKHLSGSLTIAHSGSTTLNLFNGAHVNGRGQVVNFTKLRRVLLRVRDRAAGKFVTVGGGADPFAPWLSSVSATERVDSVLFRESDTDGWTVASGAKNVQFANTSGVSVVVDYSFVGF